MFSRKGRITKSSLWLKFQYPARAIPGIVRGRELLMPALMGLAFSYCRGENVALPGRDGAGRRLCRCGKGALEVVDIAEGVIKDFTEEYITYRYL